MEAAKKRLEDQELDPESESRANKVHDIAEQIGQKLAKAEQLGKLEKIWVHQDLPSLHLYQLIENDSCSFEWMRSNLNTL